MKHIIKMSLVIVLLSAFAFTTYAQQMTKEEWQNQITTLTAKKEELKKTLENLQKEIADLQKQEAEKAQALQQCSDELDAMCGPLLAPYLASLDKIDAKLNELTALSSQDLWARKAELDSVQKWINNARKSPLSVIKKYKDRLDNQQSRLDALNQSLSQAQGEAASIYTVGTWARDRDCLWNIAKKPKIYDNPFLWPKIWQGNRDEIKDPDIIYPGQKLRIPPKADLTSEESRALRSYWAKKKAKSE